MKPGKTIATSQIAKQWSCSDKSVARTIARMKTDGLPIEYDSSEHVWRYTAPVADIPACLVSHDDRRALLFALSATANLEGLPVGSAVRRLYQRLLETLPSEKQNLFSRVMKFVRFAGQQPPEVPLSIWNAILLAMESRCTLQLQYTAGGSGKVSSPRIDPYALIMRDRRWILVGLCHSRKEILCYSLHRISSVEITDDEFSVDDSAIEAYLATDYAGYPSSSPVQTVRLLIPADAPVFVKDITWKPGETRTVDAQGNITIEFRTASVWAVERDVLSEAGWVEMVEPATGRENIRKAGQRTAQRHGDWAH